MTGLAVLIVYNLLTDLLCLLKASCSFNSQKPL